MTGRRPKRFMDTQNFFVRSEMLLGSEGIKTLRGCHVAVFGLGGVGSWCAEALARSGVGSLTLVDQDRVSPSNINRQITATAATLGRPKVRAMADRLLSVNPRIALHPLEKKYEAKDREVFFESQYDYIVDAIDLVTCKLDLIQTAISKGIPIISALGTGNKLDPFALCVADLSETLGCPFARVIRKELRKRGITHHTVVYSREKARRPARVDEAPPPGRRSIPGSVIWVPACAGLMLASHVVLTLTGERI